MDAICQQCGDKGFENAFIYCCKCLNFPVHRYCLPKLPETFDQFVRWFCENCKPTKSAKQSPLKKASSIPSTKRDHLISKGVRVTHSRIKLNKKDVACLVTETEEHGSLSRPSHQPCAAKAKVDLIKHTQLTCDSSPLKLMMTTEKGSTYPATVTEDGHQRSPSEQPSEWHNKLALTDSAQLASDCGTCSMAETEDQRQQNSPSQQHCETQTKLDLTEHNQLDCDCSAFKMKLKRKKNDVTPSVAKSEEQKRQSSPSQQPFEAHTEHALCAGSSSPLNENRTIYLWSDSRGNELKLGKRRRLISEEGSKLGKEGESVRIADSQTASGDLSNILEHNYHLHAQPIIDPIWRGSFSICNKVDGLFGGLVAHLSSKACPKVCEEAGLLPTILYSEMLPKTAVWPKSFQGSEPCDDNIALYFFPGNKSHESAFDRLVNDMIGQELAMRAVARNAELLVFTSVILPLLYWRFQGKHYLWGVFRKKQASSSHPANNHPVIPNSNTECVAYSNPVNCERTGEERNLTKTMTLEARSPLSPLSNPLVL